AALKGIVRMRPAGRVLDALIDAARDPGAEVRDRAVRALGPLGGRARDAEFVLRPMLLDPRPAGSRDRDLVGDPAEASALVAREGRTLVRDLIGIVRTGDGASGDRRAIHALRAIPGAVSEAVPDLLPGLGKSSPRELTSGVIGALGERGTLTDGSV